MRSGLFLIGTFVFAAAAQACAVKSCTLIGCQDQFSATVRRADGTFPSGTHRIEILADTTDLTCTFTYPLGTVAGDVAAAPQCPSGLSVTVGQDQVCTQTTENGVVSYMCQPIPGQVLETILLAGRPGEVHARQYVDDMPILDVAAAPSYRDYAPNGTECGPICRQAAVSWTLN